MKILTIEHLNKWFCTGEERQVIFNDFSLDLMEGQTLAVTGESGSGKSTLLNLIAGLDTLQGGTIQCCGYQVSSLDEQQLAIYRNRALGFIFQTHFLLNDFTALENVIMPSLIAGDTPTSGHERAKYLLNRVGLHDKISSYPQQLSGGESQRVSIARALMNDPALILADEPTGSLDQHNAALIQDLLMRLVAEHKKTLILVTHDPNTAATCENYLSLSKSLRSGL